MRYSNSHRQLGRRLAIAAALALSALALAASLPACGGAGACYASGGLVNECKEGWTEQECDDFDSKAINGSSWNFSSKSCDALGYGVECADGSFVTSSGDC